MESEKYSAVVPVGVKIEIIFASVLNSGLHFSEL